MIDSHVHVGGGKFAPAEEWSRAEQRYGFDGAVFVQHMGHTDNSELLAARAVDPRRYAVIAIPSALATAEAVLDAGAIGFRVGPRGLHDAPDDLEIFDVLEERGGVASVTAPFSEIASPEFAAVVDAHPSMTFRLEHVAAFDYAEREDAVRDFAPVLELARRANTAIMWSGYFFYSREAVPYRDAWPVLEASLAAFGPDRIVWSGDWNRAGGTDDTFLSDLQALRGLPFVDADTAEAILDRNPRRIFRLAEEQPA